MSTEVDQQKETPKLKFSEKEKVAYDADMQTMCDMREAFNEPRVELDGMNRAQYYEDNRKKDLSYIPPKKNKQEMRVVTGTTREKDTTLLATLTNLNTQPDITAFDDEDMIVAELGDNMGDLVKKSREIENWDKKRPIIIREMISQGDVFVEETYVEEFRNVPLERLEWNPLKDGVSELSFKERLKKIHSGCAVRMVKGNMMYLGDMSVEYVEDQDVVAVCTIISRRVVESRYSQWERWDYVPDKIETIEADFQNNSGIYAKTWAMFQTKPGWVSEVKLYRKSQNRFQIYLNGTPMLPCNYPLTALYPDGELPFAQGKLEPISGFAISKSQPSKVKVDQAIIDEVSTLMVEGMRQTRKPPMGVKGDKVYGNNIFLAGTMTNDVKANTFHSIIPETLLGLRPSEFSFYQMIKESINEKTTNEVYAGEGQEGVDTLGQAEIMQQQQMLRLGAAVDGLVNLERRLVWLRISNIINNWTLPLDTSFNSTEEGILEETRKYRKLSVETTLDEGQQGTKVFRFQDKNLPTADSIYDEEEELTKTQGRAVRVAYMNPEILRAMKYIWFIMINPTARNNDKLAQLLFVQNVKQAIEIFGPQSLNLEYLKQRYAIVIGEDYTKFFKQMDIMSMLQMGLEGSIGSDEEAAGGGYPQGGKPFEPTSRRVNTKPLQVASQ